MKQITKLSLDYQVLCRHTAFIGVINDEALLIDVNNTTG